MFKKFVSGMMIMFVMAILTGCGDPKTIPTVVHTDEYGHQTTRNITYGTYGLANSGTEQNRDIEYRVIWGNVIWGCLLCETIIMPIYFFGFSLYEPVGVLDKNHIKGSL
jgi:hypothetical protein